MPDPKESPAVVSMKKEQAEQSRRSRKGELEKGLEGTFPASDPVSVTRTAVPAGRTDVAEAERVRANDDEYPVSVEDAEPAGGSHSGSDKVHTRADVRSMWRELDDKIRENPLSAVAIVAAVAFFWGATR